MTSDRADRAGGETAHPRRADLLAAAIDALREIGPQASMDEIAAHAGVTKPTLYRAFGSKHGLYAAIAEWFISELLDSIVPLVRPSLPLRGFITAVLDTVLGRIEMDANVYAFLMRRARMELSSQRQGSDFMRDFGNAVTELMRVQLGRASLDVEGAPIWAHGTVGMITAVADWWIDEADVDRQVVVDKLSQILWDGFRPFQGALARAARASTRP